MPPSDCRRIDLRVPSDHSSLHFRNPAINRPAAQKEVARVGAAEDFIGDNPFRQMIVKQLEHQRPPVAGVVQNVQGPARMTAPPLTETTTQRPDPVMFPLLPAETVATSSQWRVCVRVNPRTISP